MEQEFYKAPFLTHGIQVIVPPDSQEAKSIMFDELSRGQFLETSKGAVLNVIASLREAGAAAVVLGCTELPLLIRAEDTDVALLDTTAIHARTAVALANQ